MAFSQLAENIYISAQISEQDIEEMLALGIQTVICHRPDDEEENQPDFDQLAEKIRAAGIAHTYHQPIVARAGVPNVSVDTGKLLEHILSESEKPVLMFCKTGARSCAAWAVLQATKGVKPEILLQQVAQCERNISALMPVLQDAFQAA